ncbi:hypothetical protein INR49_013975, partial [Caranx melampygus]
MDGMMEETATASHAHYQSSCVRMNQGVSGWSQYSEQHLNQINTSSPVYSKRSTAVMTKDTHHETALSSQIPAVTFDLGDEWDTWGDFDDENLVHASEISTTDACTANAGPQIQQPGFAATSAPLFLSQSRVKPSVTTARTPLRSVLPHISPETRKAGLSQVTVEPQNRLTLDLNKKKPSFLSEEITVKASEKFPKQASVALPTRRFDFFSTTKDSDNSSSCVSRSINTKEEEAFLG